MIIYKVDSSQKLRFVEIYAEGPYVISKSGIVGSDKAVTSQYLAEAKNVGRSNETTPEAQAILEAESALTQKLNKDYYDDC